MIRVEEYIDKGLTHSLHTTERRSFRGCRRRWSWIFQDFYYPRLTAKPLEFGIAYHEAMEVLYNPSLFNTDRTTALALAIMTFKKRVDEQYETFRTKNPELANTEAEEDYKERKRLGIGMLKHYALKVLPALVTELTPAKVEISFEVPITGPKDEVIWCKCDVCWTRYKKWTETLPDEVDAQGNSRPHRFKIRNEKSARDLWMGLPVTYGGRIDALMTDVYGRYWVVDWKTAAQLTDDGDDDHLWLDDQITSYCWALSVLGIDVAGFLYSEIRKAFPEEPEPLKRKYQGRLYSCSKSNPVDVDTFIRTVSQNDVEAYEGGQYDEYIRWLREAGPVYHRRHQINRSKIELENAGRMIYLEALDITDPNLRLYPSPGRFSCKYCAFQAPCVATNRNEDVQVLLEELYDKRSYHYWEEQPPSTDSKAGQ